MSKLHCIFLSPLLHFVLVALWTAGGKKTDYLCSDKKGKKINQKAEVFKKKVSVLETSAQTF